MRTLRWPEPFGRHIDEIHKSNDTGLCNRIFHWEIAQEINKHNNYEFKIYLEGSKWPELKELIDLPNTAISPEEIYEEPSLKLKRLIGSSEKIDKTFIDEMFTKQELSLDGTWYHSDFGHTSITDLYKNDSDMNHRPIMDIHLKDNELETMIKNLTNNMVGIHIRRGRGIKYDDYEVSTLPEEIRDDYIRFRELEGDDTRRFYMYEFIEDSKYFNLIDSILKRVPSQKFYISHDMPDELIRYYHDKYPNKIYTKEYFYDFIENRYKTPIQHVKNVVDLFALANTKMVIKHPLSTWSEFGHRYTNKKGFYFHDEINYILDNFKSAI